MIKFLIIAVVLIIGAIVFAPQIEYLFPSSVSEIPAALQDDLGQIGPKIQEQTTDTLDTLSQTAHDAITSTGTIP